MPRSFALGERFGAFIDEQVRSGRYNNASEVVRAGLRLLEDQDEVRVLRIAEIRRSIEASRADGRLLTEEEVFGPLEAKYTAMIEHAERRRGGK